jgi:hypothetical protein
MSTTVPSPVDPEEEVKPAFTFVLIFIGFAPSY